MEVPPVTILSRPRGEGRDFLAPVPAPVVVPRHPRGRARGQRMSPRHGSEPGVLVRTDTTGQIHETDLWRVHLRGATEKDPPALRRASVQAELAACAVACPVERPLAVSGCVSVPGGRDETMQAGTLLSVAASGERARGRAGRSGAGDGDRTHDNRLGKRNG